MAYDEELWPTCMLAARSFIVPPRWKAKALLLLDSISTVFAGAFHASALPSSATNADNDLDTVTALSVRLR